MVSGEGGKLSSPFLYLKNSAVVSGATGIRKKSEIQERGKSEKSDKKNDSGHAGGDGDVWDCDGKLSGSSGG